MTDVRSGGRAGALTPIAETRGSHRFARHARRTLPWLVLVVAFAAFYALYFAPALLREVLLAPGDGAIYYLPFFAQPPVRLWTDLMLSGYPAIADPQAHAVYPLRWVSPTFNVMVVSAYVVSAVGTFGLVWRLTGSRIAALGASFVVSGSGFMVAHLGHLSMIHAAAWVPSMLWAIAALRAPRYGLALVGGALAVGLSLLGGHPQISMIGLMLAGAFALHEIGGTWRAGGGRAAVAVAARAFTMVVLGIAVASPMLVPVIGAAAASVRDTWTLEDFNSFSLSWASLRLIAFPNLYGAIDSGPFGGYAGPWSPTELSLYVGVLPLFLAIVALANWRAERAPLFWVAIAGLALLLSLGAATPLGELVYRLPILGRFRAQARFGIIFDIALGVLTGYGLAAMLRTRWSARGARLLLLACAGLCVLFVASVGLAPPAYGGLRPKTWGNPSLWTPLLLMAVGLAALFALLRRPGRTSALLALVVLVVDAGSFGWFYEWRYGTTPVVTAPLPAATRAVLARLQSGEGRLLPIAASSMSVNPTRPNVNMLYDIPSAAGYTPLLSRRYAFLTGIDTAGNMSPLSPSAPLMDVLAVRWLAGGGTGAPTQLLGSGCGAANDLRRLRVRLPPHAKGALRLVTHMSCAQHLPTGQVVGQTRVLSDAGNVLLTAPIRAGVETAEWAYDRPDIRVSVAHDRPPVAETFDGGGFRGLWFEAVMPLPMELDGTETVELSLLDDVVLPLRIKSVELVDPKTGGRTPLLLTPSFPGEETALGEAIRVDGLPSIAERSRYRGMIWSVCAARAATFPDLAAALRSGRHPTGERFDAMTEVLIESVVPLPALSCTRAPTIDLLDRSPARWRLRSASTGAGMLVVSESYDPGWRARIDGVDATVIPADGLVLGVHVPDGDHVVELVWRPVHFRLTLLLCGAALLVCALIAAVTLRRSAQADRPI